MSAVGLGGVSRRQSTGLRRKVTPLPDTFTLKIEKFDKNLEGGKRRVGRYVRLVETSLDHKRVPKRDEPIDNPDMIQLAYVYKSRPWELFLFSSSSLCTRAASCIKSCCVAWGRAMG